MTPAAPPSVRRLYRPSSLPVNLQHGDLLAPPLTSMEFAASATDDEQKGLPMTSLRRGSDMKLTSTVMQAAITSTTVCCRSYTNNLISLQTDINTRSSDVVTLARPSPASSLKVTDRSFQYASPHLWNQLPISLREPVSPLYAYLNPSCCSPLSPSITPSLFHSKLKTYLFDKSFPP